MCSTIFSRPFAKKKLSVGTRIIMNSFLVVRVWLHGGWNLEGMVNSYHKNVVWSPHIVPCWMPQQQKKDFITEVFSFSITHSQAVATLLMLVRWFLNGRGFSNREKYDSQRRIFFPPLKNEDEETLVWAELWRIKNWLTETFLCQLVHRVKKSGFFLVHQGFSRRLHILAFHVWYGLSEN